MKKLLLVLLLVPLVSFGQNDGYDLCFELRNRSFDSNKDAISSLQKVLSVANLKTNRFVILPCDNIGNAMAAVYEGFRYILYKESWMSESGYWSKMAILAHEVGHHINGHTRDFLIASLVEGQTNEKQREEELEADEFAGFIVAKLGASYSQASEIMDVISSEKDDKYSTHPNKNKRLEAIKRGFDKAIKKNRNKSSNNTNHTVYSVDCNYRQCNAIAKSSDKRCKRCVSEANDFQCFQHKPKE